GLNLTETIEADTNADLSDVSDGAIFGATTSLGVNVAARTKRAVLNMRAAVVGALLAAIMLGRRHARRIVFWAGTGIAVLTCAIPLVQPDDVLWSTRIWLLIPHVITWFLVVPQIARIVGDSEPGMFAPSD
ncbi:MAG: hypothetical protein ACO21P_12000, partial [Candidatus Nanopelagicales bacterium]